MNLMGFDVDTFGNHNFDGGTAQLQQLIDLADFQYVSANLRNRDDNLTGVKDFEIFDVGGVKVGVIGITNRGTLIDGGSVNVPEFGFASVDGEWIIEGHGVEPDIAVTDHPGELAKGRDPQMDAAIAELLRRIEENPVVFAPPPPMEGRLAGSGPRRSRVGQRN